MSASGWDAMLETEREECALICDREAIIEICNWSRFPEGAFGDPRDPELLDAWSRADYEKTVSRALATDTEEARGIRAAVSQAGRLAARIRMRNEAGANPADWRSGRRGVRSC